ncbi:MAG: hypothetical protein JJU36_09955 [Phycisphaeraceae bacterium]|nr:hypothetical protein [Phycisphaeraceae bacterium]
MEATKALALMAVAILVLVGCTRHHITADTRHELHTTHRIDMTIDVNVKLDEHIAEALRWQREYHQREGAKDGSPGSAPETKPDGD